MDRSLRPERSRGKFPIGTARQPDRSQTERHKSHQPASSLWEASPVGELRAPGMERNRRRRRTPANAVLGMNPSGSPGKTLVIVEPHLIRTKARQLGKCRSAPWRSMVGRLRVAHMDCRATLAMTESLWFPCCGAFAASGRAMFHVKHSLGRHAVSRCSRPTS
jgi:hypothetical protein